MLNNSKKDKKTKSLKQIFIYSMIFVTAIQFVIFFVTILFGGVFSNVVNYSYDPLLETSGLRKTALEAKLNNCSNTLTNYNTTIKNELQKISAKYNQPVSALLSNPVAKTELFTIVSDEIKAITSTEGITGGFIILDYNKDITTTAVDALYLRADNNVGGSRISLLIGNDTYLPVLGLSKNSYWRNQLSFVEMDNCDFYTEPLRLGEEYKNISTEKLGYWSMIYDVNYSDNNCIAYAIPLRDSVGVTYGVIGVEISDAYLKNCMPYFELNSKGQGSYIIGVADSIDATEFTRITTSGDSFDKINQYAQTYTYSSKPNSQNIYNIEPKSKTLSKVYTTKDKLEINTLAEYNSKVWVLSGAVEGMYLLSFVNGLKLKILLAFAVTAVLSLIMVFLAARFVTRPINRFVEEVEAIRPDNLKTPKAIYVKEFNELGNSIEKLTKDMSDFSAKAGLIINMAGVPVGAFEYDKTSNVVFCTDIALQILKIENKDKKLFVSRKEFEDKISVFMKTIGANINQVYTINNADEQRFIHIKTAVNNGKILGILRDVTEETLAELKQLHIKEHDQMTGLLNREGFNTKVKKRISAKIMATYAMVIINVDNVSRINKEYGTTTGDLLIKAVGELLSKVENRTNVIARTIGDEFCIFMDVRNRIEVDKFLTTLKEELNNYTIEANGDVIVPEITIGIAMYPKDCSNFDELVQNATFAMSSGKKTNKGGITYYSKELYEQHQAIEKSNSDIDLMIKQGNISYAYQPIIDTSSGEIYGYEALMRPSDGYTTEAVLEYATENNLNYEIERTTWFNSLKGYTQQVSCLSPKKLFINSIPSQLLTDEDFNNVENSFKDHLDNIVMEVVESEQIENHIIAKKREIKEKWNCLIALDDYGSGYSNDNTLLSVKPDLIKLDIELVTDIESNSDKQSLVKNMVSYAHNRDIKVLAEGIESKEQMYCLLSIGVDLLQGFYLAKPDETVLESIDPAVKEEITGFDPNDMFVANVSLSM